MTALLTNPKSGDGNHRGFELSLMGEDEQVQLLPMNWKLGLFRLWVLAAIL